MVECKLSYLLTVLFVTLNEMNGSDYPFTVLKPFCTLMLLLDNMKVESPTTKLTKLIPWTEHWLVKLKLEVVVAVVVVAAAAAEQEGEQEKQEDEQE